MPGGVGERAAGRGEGRGGWERDLLERKADALSQIFRGHFLRVGLFKIDERHPRVHDLLAPLELSPTMTARLSRHHASPAYSHCVARLEWHQGRTAQRAAGARERTAEARERAAGARGAVDVRRENDPRETALTLSRCKGLGVRG